MKPSDIDTNTFYVFAVSLIVISLMLKAYNDNIYTSSFFLMSVLFLTVIVISEVIDFLQKKDK